MIIRWKRWLIAGTAVILISCAFIISHHRLRDRLVRSTFLGLWIVSKLSQYGWYKDSVTPKHLPSDYIRALYQLLGDIHDVLEACHIPYWIEAGTLLGAVRHGGIIPWDDDIDVQVFDNMAAAITKKAIPIFKALGYLAHDLPNKGGIKIYFSPDQFKTLPNETPPACDIFFAKETKKGELFIEGCNKSLKLSTLTPLKLYSFGTLKVWGPANPIPYLTEHYGKNWATMAKRGNDHINANSENSSHNYFIITDFSPGKYSKPIEDHKDFIKNQIELLN